MKSKFFLLIGFIVGAMGVIAGAASPPSVGPKMLIEGGDCLGDEILAWERLRAERRTIVEEDDSPPIACVDGAGRVYLATGSGKLLASDDGGQNFAPVIEIEVNGRAVKDLQAMGVIRSDKPERVWLGKPGAPIVIAFRDNGKLLIARSEDTGKTWQSMGELMASGYGNLQAGGVRIVQLIEGTLLLAVAAWNLDNKGDPEGLVFASKDGGKTWSKWGSLGPRCAGANLLQLKSGEMLAAITYQGAHRNGDPGAGIKRDELFNNVVVARSADGGKTWRDYQCVTRYKESPADIAELSDGAVLLTYGEQNFPYGGRAVLSRDGGRSWDKRVYILGHSTVQVTFPKVWGASSPLMTEPGWRVSSVVMKEDLILSVYTRGALVVKVWETRDKFTDESVDKGKSIMSVCWTLKGMNKPPISYPGVIGKVNEEGYLDNARILIKPEHVNWGGDYLSFDEILVYERAPAERYRIGSIAGSEPVLHVDSDGNPVLFVYGADYYYRSKDNGRTWEQIRGWSGRNVIGFLRDGTMIASAGTRINVKPDGSHENAVQLFRSTDWGKTWSEPFTIAPPGSFDTICGGTRICELPDGTILLAEQLLNFKMEGVAKFGEDFGWRHVVYRSRDGGRTWGDWSYSAAGASSMVVLSSGRVLSAWRYDRFWQIDDVILKDDIPQNRTRVLLVRGMVGAISEDNGYTWTLDKTLTRYNECPGDFTETSDGTVVLTYQQKNNPTGGRAIVSRDGGRTWDKILYMLCWYTNSGGHATSVSLKDGNVLTVNQGWFPGENANVLEATIWKPLEREIGAH